MFLDATAFHPRPSGGLDADTGWLVGSGGRVRVVDTVMKNGNVAHVVEEVPDWFRPGVEVHGVLESHRQQLLIPPEGKPPGLGEA